MNRPDGALQEPRRPFVSSNLWVPLLLILVACGGIVFYGQQLVETLKQSSLTGARAQGLATAREISGFIEREQERLHAFVEEKGDEVRRILDYPDNWPAIDAIQTSIKRLFRGAFAFSVTGTDGKPLFEDFDGLVGPVCQASMRDFVSALERGDNDFAIPPIHPVPGAYHFDLISPWTLNDGQSGLFFVSMAPDRIAGLLAAAEQASGTRLWLVNRDDPTLIEVSSAGARDRLQGDIRLQPGDLGEMHFATDLAGTNWRLLVVPDHEALNAAVNEVYARVAILVAALLLISAALLFVIRRFEQRNSSLFMRSLQSSVSRQRAILQSMVDGMVTIDASGRILNVNNAVTTLFGYEPNELIGANVRVLMPEPHRSAHDDYLRNYLATGESKILGKGREVMARRRDGRLFPVLLTLGESVEGDEHIFVGILHDMSAYNEAQRQIVAQAMTIRRSNQELEEVSQIASKDLQEPLQRIAMIGEALRSEHMGALSRDEKAQLKSLTEEARDMSELVKGLADYTRVERHAATRPVSLDAILKEVQADLASAIQASGAQITVEPLGEVAADANQLRQLFWNLIDNALKFRDPARTPAVRVSLAHETGDTDEADAGRIVVLVSDNGIGIPQDRLEAVFEAFCRLHPRERYPGMGLGLSFCRKIVDRLGGDISAISTPGEGSTFRVALPRPR